MNDNGYSLLFEDDHYIFLNKTPGKPSHPDKTGDISFLEIVQNKMGRKLFPLTRLDRPVSGVLIFAKSKKDTSRFWTLNDKGAINKVYLAVVENKISGESGKIEKHLIRDGRKHKARISSSKDPSSKKAFIEYKHVLSLERYELYKVQSLTGRFHQIRILCSHAGAPIKGDVKYGARRSNKNRGIHLHCWNISFIRSDSSKKYDVQAPLPEDPLWKVVSEHLDQMDL